MPTMQAFTSFHTFIYLLFLMFAWCLPLLYMFLLYDMYMHHAGSHVHGIILLMFTGTTSFLFVFLLGL